MSKADSTRLTILHKAFELIYKNGYQATSIDDILAMTKVTKGAFFYHFKNKDEMGLALINEVMYEAMYPSLIFPLLDAKDPLKEIYAMMKELLLANPFMQVKYGCPANNLIQEMAPLSLRFSKSLSVLVDQWEKALQAALTQGKKAGLVRNDINTKQAANFIMSGYGGVRILGRLHSDKKTYTVYLKELKRYLEEMKY
ncbi:TetR family transcriptional regulator [Sphingobacteriaceae bacterium]|nr:TetR family transcriptional regulator [Sphingobacteriaceae bacterium]